MNIFAKASRKTSIRDLFDIRERAPLAVSAFY